MVVKKAVQIESEFFTIVLVVDDKNIVRFPRLEPGWEPTIKAFMDGLTLEQVQSACDRMKWRMEVLE